MTKILVTGASGFIGKALCKILLQKNYKIIALTRSNPCLIHPNIEWAHIDLAEPLAGDSIWSGVDTVIHLAGRVHCLKDKSQPHALDLYLKENTYAAEQLAKKAHEHHVKHFIFLSTIKVNGEKTEPGKCFNEKSEPNPVDPYSISKLEAEKSLKKTCQNSSMAYTIIRPPLVYGPGVKANFAKLIKLAKLPLPLPTRSIKNKRSLIYVDNLTDFIIHCLQHRDAWQQTFLISDNHDASTPELIQLIKTALGRSNTQFPVPHWLLSTVKKLPPCQAILNRLSQSLQLSPDKAIRLLGWQPPYTLKEGIKNSLTSE